MPTKLHSLLARPVEKSEEPRYRELMAQHHYLGDLAKIGHTLWYVATHGVDWVALLSFSTCAWKCGVRDRWIGWNFQNQYDHLHLIANNSRFLILPEWHHPNVGSKVLSLCRRRIAADWLDCFGQPLLLLETFVDPTRVAPKGGLQRTGAAAHARRDSPVRYRCRTIDYPSGSRLTHDCALLSGLTRRTRRHL